MENIVSSSTEMMELQRLYSLILSDKRNENRTEREGVHSGEKTKIPFSVEDILVIQGSLGDSVEIKMAEDTAADVLSSLSSYNMSGKNNVIKLTGDEVETLPHDLMGLAIFKIGSGFDMKLETIGVDEEYKNEFGLMKNWKNRTPDLILRDKREPVVIEFKTSAVLGKDSDSQFRGLFENAEVYKRGLKSHKTKTGNIIFKSVVATRRGVRTDMPISEARLSDAHKAFLFGLSMRNTIRQVLIKGQISTKVKMVRDAVLSVDIETLEKRIEGKSDDPLIVSNREFSEIVSDAERDGIKPGFEQLQKELDKIRRGVEKFPVLGPNKLKKYMETMTGKNKTTKNLKRVVNFPVLLPSRNENNFEVPKCRIPAGEEATVECWRLAIRELRRREDVYRSFFERGASDTRELLFEGFHQDNLKKKFTHIDISGLSAVHKMDLAKKGVDAKRYANHPELVAHKKRKKFSGLHFDSDVSHITSFIEGNKNSELLSKKVDFPTVLGEKTKYLVKKATDLSGSTEFDEGLDEIVKDLDNSWATHYMEFKSFLCNELNLERRHNIGKRDTLILKPIKNFNAWLLIRTTNASNHVFYSLMAKSDEVFNGPCFQSPIRSDKGWNIYPFFSLDAQTISHGLMTAFRSPGMQGLIKEVWSPEDYIDGGVLKSTQERRHFRHYFLSEMSDKAETSEDNMQSRFGYQQLNRGQNCDALAFLSKLSTVVRSPLNLWNHKRMITNFTEMEEALKNLSRDRREGLLSSDDIEVPYKWSWVSGRVGDITTEQSLYVSYSGYFHNKEEGYEGVSAHKILRKIVKMEVKVETTRLERVRREEKAEEKDPEPSKKGKTAFSGFEKMKMGDLESVSDALDHEFSRKFVASMGMNMREDILAEYTSMDHFIESEIYPELAKVNWTDFMTFKAGAVKAPDETLSREEIERVMRNLRTGNVRSILKGVGQRTKSIENFWNFVEELIQEKDAPFSENPYVFLPMIMEILVQEGWKANVFKKLQYGGIREILVLTKITRLVQLFIETIARVMCRQTQGETMVQPDLKDTYSRDHLKEVYKEAQKLSKTEDSSVAERVIEVTRSNSGDSATWCQQFVMGVFIDLIGSCLGDCQLTNVMRIMLNCSTLKKLEIPVRLIQDFHMRQDAQSWSKEENILKAEFLRTRYNQDGSDPYKAVGLDSKMHTGILVSKRNGTLLTNRSNMWQGILHYLSSWLHAAFKALCKRFLRATYKIFIEKMRVTSGGLTHTWHCSSDDFLDILTALSLKADSEEVAAELDRYCLLMANAMKLTCARCSWEKSTIAAVTGEVEYNSVWNMRMKIISVKLKFVYSAFRVPKAENFKKRVDELATARSQLLENGCSIRLAAVIQRLQARCHYFSLGCGVSKSWDDYSTLLQKIPHPSLGFFSQEKTTLVGLSGGRNAHFTVFENSDRAMKMNHLLHSEDGGMQLEEGTENISNIFLRLFNNEKLDDMRERMGLADESLEKMSEKEPEAFFYHPTTATQCLTKSKIKMLGDCGAGFSFFRTCDMMFVSAYVLHSKCISKFEKKAGKDKKTLVKITLLQYMEEVLKRVNAVSLKDARETHSLLYPDSKTIILLNNMGSSVQNKRTKTTRTRTRKTKVVFSKMANTLPKDLKEVCAYKWFGVVTDRSEPSLLEKCFAAYRAKYPWLEGEFTKTFEEARKQGISFRSKYSLISFVKNCSIEHRSVKVLGRGKHRETIESTIGDIILHQYYPKSDIVRGSPKEEKELEVQSNRSDSLLFQSLLVKIKRIISGPREPIEKEHEMLSLLENTPGKHKWEEFEVNKSSYSYLEQRLLQLLCFVKNPSPNESRDTMLRRFSCSLWRAGTEDLSKDKKQEGEEKGEEETNWKFLQHLLCNGRRKHILQVENKVVTKIYTTSLEDASKDHRIIQREMKKYEWLFDTTSRANVSIINNFGVGIGSDNKIPGTLIKLCKELQSVLQGSAIRSLKLKFHPIRETFELQGELSLQRLPLAVKRSRMAICAKENLSTLGSQRIKVSLIPLTLKSYRPFLDSARNVWSKMSQEQFKSMKNLMGEKDFVDFSDEKTQEVFKSSLNLKEIIQPPEKMTVDRLIGMICRTEEIEEKTEFQLNPLLAMEELMGGPTQALSWGEFLGCWDNSTPANSESLCMLLTKSVQVKDKTKVEFLLQTLFSRLQDKGIALRRVKGGVLLEPDSEEDEELNDEDMEMLMGMQDMFFDEMEEEMNKEPEKLDFFEDEDLNFSDDTGLLEELKNTFGEDMDKELGFANSLMSSEDLKSAIEESLEKPWEEKYLNSVWDEVIEALRIHNRVADLFFNQEKPKLSHAVLLFLYTVRAGLVLCGW